MSLRVSIMLLAFLTCSCVAREQPRTNPQHQRFEAVWLAAADWDFALHEMRVHVPSPEALPHTSALFWPEHKDKPGLALGEITGMQDLLKWRNEKVLGRSYRIVLTPDADSRVGGLNLPETSYAWLLPATATLDDSLVDLDGSTILLLPPARYTRVRIVFRLLSEPVPTTLYAHGSEVLVASWGAALQPIAFELMGDDGNPVYVFQNKSGPG